jgi:ABC-type phosphate transport system substrate-binding protein
MLAGTALLSLASAGVQPHDDYGEDIAIIINSRNPAVIGATDAKNIFLGRITNYPIYETEVNPVIIQNDEINHLFHEHFLGISTGRFKTNWSKLLFTGQVKPPVLVDDPQSVIEQVVSDESAIGYVPLSKVTNDVKIAYVIRKG